ncbi:S8 family peptidase [Lachnospiraceae bacterium LCP25S3_G4]
MYTSEENIIPLDESNSLIFIPGKEEDNINCSVYPYRVFPSIFTLNSLVDLEDTGVEKIRRNSNLALYGSSVLVGIIDTGVDYTHPAFRYSDGTSRILSIWDQTIQKNSTPQGFPFGTEYKKPEINLALKSDDPSSVVPSIDEIGHGTAIASIAAGSIDLNNDFSGIVPSAELVVVKLKQAKKLIRQVHFVPEDAICYQESDVIFAVRYLFNIARSLRRPLALCIALGTTQGGHDGLGATSDYLALLNQMSQIGVSVAGGNEGNNQRHYFGTVDSKSFTKEFELKVNQKDSKFAFEIWPYKPSRFSVIITTPTGDTTGEIYPGFEECRKFNFIYESSVALVSNITIEEETGDQLILIRLKNPIEGIWRFKVRNLENEVSSFHAWLPAGDLISKETYFIESNPDTTLTSPGNADSIMTFTAYNQENNSILIESGRGYTRNNRIKPDLAAPGYNLTCATINGKYGTLTGSGAATAYATGIVAMILEWAVIKGNYTSITGIDINSLLIRGATRDTRIIYPNNIWGYGRINIDGFFMKLTI